MHFCYVTSSTRKEKILPIGSQVKIVVSVNSTKFVNAYVVVSDICARSYLICDGGDAVDVSERMNYEVI